MHALSLIALQKKLGVQAIVYQRQHYQANVIIIASDFPLSSCSLLLIGRFVKNYFLHATILSNCMA